MNIKEISEIRRRQKKTRSNMHHIYGCYVNEKKEIISEFCREVVTMKEQEAEKFFSLFHRVLGGARGDSLGKTLLEITFATAQVADSPEHKLLMNLRGDKLHNDGESRMAFYKKVMESLEMEGNYLILLGTESYDVPVKSKDGLEQDESDEVFTYTLCAICPVKTTKAVLHYAPESDDFRDGNIVNAASSPLLGFLFPAFDNRATNIYNALYFNKNQTDNHEDFVKAIFSVEIPEPAKVQEQNFSTVVAEALGGDCHLDTVQTIHEQICNRIELHKESKAPEAMVLTKSQFTEILEGSGAEEEQIQKFSKKFDEHFGAEAEICPHNIVNPKKFVVETPDVTVRVDADNRNMIQTRTIGGVKYILIQADETVTVNGIPITIE